jgi:hypothetical protein
MDRKKFVPCDCRENIPRAHVSRSALANQDTISTAMSQVNPSDHLQMFSLIRIAAILLFAPWPIVPWSHRPIICRALPHSPLERSRLTFHVGADSTGASGGTRCHGKRSIRALPVPHRRTSRSLFRPVPVPAGTSAAGMAAFWPNSESDGSSRNSRDQGLGEKQRRSPTKS